MSVSFLVVVAAVQHRENNKTFTCLSHAGFGAKKKPGRSRASPSRPEGEGAVRDETVGCLPADARAHEVLGVAVDELDVAGHAPGRVELHLRADPAVELAVGQFEVLVAGHR